MTSGRYGLVLHEVGRLLGGGTVATLGAGQLLERFAADRDSSAFEALVSRHGPMVLGTCRRMLSDPLDVEDAFQATFLVLARKAGSIQDADRLGPWLHGVARRVATRSRALSGRRKSLERQGGEEPSFESPDLLEGFEVREALDEELSRLPEKYRAPLVLCYLEGLTHDEAAAQLRWPVGTVRSRLAGGRDRLRAALTRRGFAPSAAVPTVLHSISIPQTLLSTTVRVATSAGVPSVHVLNLAKGALIAMTWNKLKLVAVVGMMAGLTVGGAGVAAQKGGEGQAKAPVVGESNDDPIKKVKEELDSTVRLMAVQEERKQLQRSLEAIVSRIEQIRYDQAKTLPKLEKQAGELRDRIDSVERKWKELAASGTARIGEPSPSKDLEAASKEIQRLEAELRASRAEALDAKRKMEALATEFARPLTETSPPKPEIPLNKLEQPPGAGGSASGDAEAKKAANPRHRSTLPSVIPLGNPQVMIIPGEQDRVTVLNTETGARATQRLAGRITEITPIIGPGSVSLRFRGPEVRQVIAYDHQGGKWYSQDLVEPTTEADPVRGGDEVIYQIGRFVYVFSFEAKKWGVLELKSDPRRQILLPGMSGMPKNGKMIVPEGDLIHVYDPKTGEWTHIDTKDDK
jgi:RNA polymerase sigma factor (sigma-70 family)